MADIYNFRPSAIETRDGASRGETVPSGTATCEIIIFPGVRYERWAEAAPPVHAKSGGRRKPAAKQRELELAD